MFVLGRAGLGSKRKLFSNGRLKLGVLHSKRQEDIDHRRAGRARIIGTTFSQGAGKLEAGHFVFVGWVLW